MAEVGQRVERRAHRAPGVKHVIDQHHASAIERERDVAAKQARIAGRAAPVVAVGRNIERADGDRALAALGHRLGQPFGEASAAAHDTDQDDIRGAVVALDDLVRDPLDRARDRRRVERERRLEVSLRGHRGIARGEAAQKKTRLRAQPGPDIYTSIVVPFPPSLWRVKG
jgi:hypothetical protein